jgi:DNA-binding protein HU-beta
MNKHDLVSKIADDAGVTKSRAQVMIDAFLDHVTRALKKGDSITFVGFGTFKTSVRKARLARNPQTGAEIKLPRRRVARFVAGKGLKHAVK